jgi:hypothetical protein
VPSGNIASAKLSNVRVKFLKFDPVERLWNAGRKFSLLERIQKSFPTEKSLFIVLGLPYPRCPWGELTGFGISISHEQTISKNRAAIDIKE